MTRRGFVGRALEVLAAAGLLRPTPAAARRWGYLDVDAHRAIERDRGIFLRVVHQGADVTGRCRRADDTGRGWAELLRHRDGRPYLGARGGAACDVVRGVHFEEGRRDPGGVGGR